MAWSVSRVIDFDGLLCPMLDARRMEVYCKVVSGNLKETVSDVEARVIDETSFSELLPQARIMFFGPGAEKCRSLIKHSNARFLQNIYPSAAAMGEIIWKKFQASRFEDVIHFEPRYLKDFVAKKSEKSLFN